MIRTVWVRCMIDSETQIQAEREVDEAIETLPFDATVYDNYDMADEFGLD